MIDRFQVVPAAYVVLRRDDQILLQLRRGTGYMDGYWATAAAGHVETDESVVAAALREAREEIGVDIAPAALIPLTAMHRTAGNHQAIDERVDFFFSCLQWAGEPRLVEPEKAADLAWFDLAGLPENVVAHERFVFERLRDDSLSPIVTFGF
ncbi:MAG: NUDIX hydrolase [Nocardioidaceae bacterium]